MRKITLKLLTKLPDKYLTAELMIIVVLFIYGVIGSYFIMGLNLLDSVYYSVITMATVGYGDYMPHTGIQKIFATTLAIAGVALLAYVFNLMLSNFQNKMRKYSKGAKKMNRIQNMDDFYILCGYGRVGKIVFEELSKRNQNIIVIDKNKEILEDIEEKDNIVTITKDATEDDMIAKFASENCRSVIISTGDDVTNVFVVLTIRETNPDAWIVTRASKFENISRLKKAGANKIVSPEIIGGKDLYFESAKPHLLKITVRHDFDIMLDEFKIIVKHKCVLENIEYHIPGIKTPLSREINAMELEDGEKFINLIENKSQQKESVKNLYKSVNNVHSHLISGPDNATFDKLIKDLREIEEIIGINLTNEEIAKITEKEIN